MTDIPAGTPPTAPAVAPDEGGVTQVSGKVDFALRRALSASHKRIAFLENELAATAPSAPISERERGLAAVRDLDADHFGALHRLQHDGTPRAKPRLGGSIIGWAADEIAALRAALASFDQGRG